MEYVKEVERAQTSHLPTLRVSGMEDPVVQVIDEGDGQIVYTLRIKGRQFGPKVFAKGLYTVRVGQQPGGMKEVRGIKPLEASQHAELQVDL